MKKQPVIGIVTVLDEGAVPRVFANINYPNAVIRGGGVPVMLPVTKSREILSGYLTVCDGFLFSGGQDLSPCRYGELPSRLLGPTSLLLDDYQLSLMKLVLEAKKPFLAICRGIQVLNVACGGTLYQDLTEFSPTVSKHMQETDRGDVSHPVTIQEGTLLRQLFGTRIWTNSYHHQALKQVAECLQTAALSDDGIVEAVEVKDYPFGIGVQWHPEAMLPSDDAMLPLFVSLVQKASIFPAGSSQTWRLHPGAEL